MRSINIRMDNPQDTPKSSEQEYEEIIPYIEEPRDPSKTGNKPKQLVAVEVYGYEVGRGKTKRVVVPEDVYKLAAIGCNTLEIARWFDIHENTLRYNFNDVIEKGRQDLKTRLRSAMIKNALNGNVVMQIFLAKNFLGMSDNPTDTEATAPLPFTDSDI